MMPGQRGIGRFRSRRGTAFFAVDARCAAAPGDGISNLSPHMQRMKNSFAPMIVKSRRANLVLVCRKCLKRAADGKSVKRGLKAELKGRGAKKSQRPRLILTNCFGVCPKRAVVTASAHTLRRGEFLLVSDRSSMSDAADALLEIQD
jgi:hypothetical protein